MIKSRYKWINENKDNIKNVDENKLSINLKPVIKKILISRHIDTDEKVEKFINGTISDFYDPYLIKDMDKAVERIIKALKGTEKVTVYGDYDVDGITSTMVMYSYLKSIGMNIDYYIPNRLNEGYGMNKSALKKIAQNETDLIITVDTGITAINEAQIIKDLGMELVITDHHEVASDIPQAVAVVDSKRNDDTYPFDMLAGVGVAFKVISALDIMLKKDEELSDKYNELNIDISSYLEFVCLGTISDIVTLQDENRIIVKEGMKRIKETKNVGLKALIKATLGDGKDMTARDIAFMIVPKLNAAGRIAEAKIGVELFMEEDETKAELIVKELLKKNDERKKCEQRIFEEAIEIIENNEEYKNDKIIIVKNEGWHHGVIGIVASKISETYFKPTIIFNEENNTLSGSARTMGGVNIFEVIENARSTLLRFGGHEGAAGLSLELKNYEEFRRLILDYANQNITDDLLMPYINVDMDINPDDIDLETINEMKILEPFGAGNEEPVFKVNAKVANATLMGKNNEHLRLKIKGLENSFDCVGFYKSDIYENLVVDKEFSLLGTLSINEFNGMSKVQMMLQDIKSNLIDQLENGYNKSLYDKIKTEGVKELLEEDKKVLLNVFESRESIENNNENGKENSKEIKIFTETNEIFNFIDNYITEFDANNKKDENSLTDEDKVVFITNNKEDLESIMSRYEDEVALFYGKISDAQIDNSICKEGKKVILLTNNMQKLVDLRKKYTIIYIDSLVIFKKENNLNVFCISKEEVIKVYKRMMYLTKINTSEIYIDDLLYNLRELNMYKILISLKILKQLGIMNVILNEDDKIIFSINKDVKNPIENSEIYKIIRKV